MSWKRPNWLFVVAAALAVIINCFSWQAPFFWDTLLSSSVVQYLLEQGTSNFILPPELDAGHPPLFYLYLAVVLGILGKSLLAAHLAILPFILLGVFSFLRLLQLLEIGRREQWIGLFLFFAIPAVISQYSLVSYDAVLLSLYLAALVLFLENRKWLFTICLLLIAGITGRGIFAIAAVFLTCLVFHRSIIRHWWFTFLPALLLYAGWYGYHYGQTGYIFSPDNGWSDQRGLADWPQIRSNLIAISRILFDLGIVVLFAWNVFVFIVHRKLSFRYRIWLVPFLIFSASFVFLSNPINHRYYLVVYVLMLLPVLKWMQGKNFFFPVVLTLLLIAGHMQIYPPKISNGWDCTLAHVPYAGMKEEMRIYMDRSGIDQNKVGSVFPMITSSRQDRFGKDARRLRNIHGMNMDSLQYVLYSNIGNDFSDRQIDQLKKWKPLKIRRAGQVEMILYENPVYFP